MIDEIRRLICIHKFKTIGRLYSANGGMIVIKKCKKCGLKRSELIQKNVLEPEPRAGAVELVEIFDGLDGFFLL